MRSFFLNKYFAAMSLAFRQQIAMKGLLAGRIFVFIVVVYLFHQVFQSVGAPFERVWYLAITEWIVLSVPSLSFIIEQDIRTGQMAYFILRPMHYLGLRFCEGLGGFSVRFILLGIACLCLGKILTGEIPGSTLSWGMGTLFALLSGVMYIFISILIGLSAFVLREIHPAVFLNQTATFCFGGLIVPLSFYPEVWQKISFATPYPWMLWWPAQKMLNAETIPISIGVLASLGWLLFLGISILLFYRLALKTFVAEGG